MKIDILKDLLSNIVVLSALYSWFIAQFIKITIELLKRKRFKTKDFILRAIFGTGGMPSSHTATITAVTLSIGLINGFNSSIFGLSFVLFIIVIRDATGVRLSAGNQATVINKISEELYKKFNMEFKPVKEIRGHTPLECFVGILVGILVTLGIYFI